jgi:SP family general alpha glucoside:H+ symporter-like MFS transporter
MEGYSAILIGNFFAFPTFAKNYGKFDPTTNTYQLAAAWQSGLNAASGVGAFFGIMANGHLVSRYGPKRVLLGSLLLVTCFIAMAFSAPTIGVPLNGQLLWCIFATIAPAYASGVLPLSAAILDQLLKHVLHHWPTLRSRRPGRPSQSR